ncbi:MAG: AsmA family protein [Alphaproteobacteria bacterium]
MRWVVRLLKLLVVLVVVAVVAVAGGLYYITHQPPKQVMEENIKRFTGFTAHIEGTPTLSLWPALHLTIEKLTIDAFSQEGAEKTPLFVGNNLVLRLPDWFTLQQGVAVEEVAMTNPTISLIKPKVGMGNWENPFARGGKKSGGAVAFVPVKALTITNLNFTYDDRAAGKTTRLTGANFSIGGADAAKIQLTATGALDGKAFDVRGQADIRDIVNVPVTLRADVPQAAVVLDGALQESAFWQGKVQVQSADVKALLRTYAPQAVLPVTLEGPLTLEAAGRFGAVEGEAKNLLLRVGESVDVAGHATYNLADKELSTKLTFNPLDATKLGLCGKTPDGASQPTEAAETPWSDRPLALEGLQTWSVAADISIKTLRCVGVPVQAVAFKLKTDKRSVSLENLTAKLPNQGLLTGDMRTGVRNGLDGHVNIQLANLPVEAFVTGKMAEKLRLPLDGDIKLTFAGTTTRQLAQSLAGSLDFSAQDGQIPGAALAGMAVSMERLLAGAVNQNSGGDLDKLVAKYDVEQGVATATDVQVRTAGSQLNVTATGKIDIAAWAINHRIEPVVNASTLVKVPVTIRGNLSHPQIVPEIANLQNLGTGVGAAIGGPLGAAIGAQIGNILGGGNGQVVQPSVTTSGTESTPEAPQPINPLDRLIEKNVNKVLGIETPVVVPAAPEAAPADTEATPPAIEPEQLLQELLPFGNK